MASYPENCFYTHIFVNSFRGSIQLEKGIQRPSPARQPCLSWSKGDREDSILTEEPSMQKGRNTKECKGT